MKITAKTDRERATRRLATAGRNILFALSALISKMEEYLLKTIVSKTKNTLYDNLLPINTCPDLCIVNTQSC